MGFHGEINKPTKQHRMFDEPRKNLWHFFSSSNLEYASFRQRQMIDEPRKMEELSSLIQRNCEFGNWETEWWRWRMLTNSTWMWVRHFLTRNTHINGGFLKWRYPKSSQTRGFWMLLELKPMVSGIPHFKKHSNAKNTMAYQIQLERAAFQAL